MVGATTVTCRKIQGWQETKMVDLFGKWVPFTNLDMGDAAATNLPQVIVNNDDILEIFDLDADGRIPFNILDDLCNKHGIDITSLSMSQTHFGNIYRAHVLMH